MSIRDRFRRKLNSDSSDTNSDSDSSITNISNLYRSRSPLRLESKSCKTIKSVKMALPQLKQEFLGMVPEFNGETELLPRFLSIGEKLVNKFYNTADPTDFQNEYLMSSLLAKIKGEAAINISSCLINNWQDLKNALLNAYADKRDIYTLNIEMCELKQGNESPFDFYNRMQHILNLILSYNVTHFVAAESTVLSQYARNLALRVLLRGLKDPIGTLMRTKNPPDLNTALNMLTNDFQIETAQQKMQNFKKFEKPIFKSNFQTSKVSQPLQLTNYAHNSFAQRNNQPHFSGNSGPKTNVFRPNQTKNFSKPTPMSVSTRNTYRPQSNDQNQYQHNYRPINPQFRNNNKPNFIVEELYNIDNQNHIENTAEPDEQHQYDFDCQEPYVEHPVDSDIDFFRDEASNPPDYQKLP